MNKLPQAVKNLISEFNAEHRVKMNIVFQELLAENVCWYCDTIIENNRLIQYIMFQRYSFCCLRCATDGEEIIREHANN
jgi:hypothetical protein